ncbi:hypothetical protein SISNIDRAFT_481592 [Sistotremastrum niveocremeum HHB9708]|uniref:Uncharacterized protein n=1 Tax=Sistotremastrum niveocremeum HHB9708 TaxID=1314777 RepID=A0A164ZFW7_9AGAM|nr:hypothetical protein SISNIDRAFT_481592 [Sistotremastrum niveocremeum HHB9708]
MSHLTSRLPFARRVPSDIRRAELHPKSSSPPDSELTDVPSQHGAERFHASYVADDDDDALPPFDSPFSRVKKVSTLSYGQHGIRDTRTQTRTSKWLVVVLPPPSLPHGLSSLGHTLSVGPPTRFGSGILMPLMSTMYHQLTAIAREFNFPSTSGLCLYLHVSSPSSLEPPRISDESWSLLWSHLFDEPFAPSPQSPLPIGGWIEFDVDPRRARWFDTWLNAQRRQMFETPRGSLSTIPATRDAAFSVTEADGEWAAPNQTNERGSRGSSPKHRHVPRRLSLVEKRPPSASSSVSRLPVRSPNGRSALNPLSQRPQHTHSLSPVVQVDEQPDGGGNDLASVVQSWRESTLTPASARSALWRTTMDAADSPNSVPVSPDPSSAPIIISLDASDDSPESARELDLNEFRWSISSYGPPSGDTEPNQWPSPLDSLDLPERLRGSVCNTPSIATSFGADDSTAEEDLLPDPYRLPSPDIAWRAIESVPCTPSTCTSWGPPSPTSSFSSTIHSRPPSVDLAHRSRGSAPVSPSTYPHPLSAHPVPLTVEGLAQAFSEHHSNDIPVVDTTSSNVEIGVFKQVWPYIPYEISTPHDEVDQHVRPSKDAVIHDDHAPVPEPNPNPFSVYPYFDLYPSLYPELSIYPPIAVQMPSPLGASATLSSEVAMQNVQRCLSATTRLSNADSPDVVQLEDRYPFFNIYLPVYPHLIIYPPMSALLDSPSIRAPVSEMSQDVLTTVVYPNFNIYPPQYPYFDIYCEGSCFGVNETSEGLETSALRAPLPNLESPWILRTQYPTFILYPPIYPDLIIYPPMSMSTTNIHRPHNHEVSRDLITTSLTPAYPCVLPYPPVYPHLDPYNQGHTEQRINQLLPTQQPDNDRITAPGTYCNTSLAPSYPNMVIYPAVYPFVEPYPLVVAPSVAPCVIDDVLPSLELSTTIKPEYPKFSLYPPVYPFIEIYPDTLSNDTVGYHVMADRELLAQVSSDVPSTQANLTVTSHLDSTAIAITVTNRVPRRRSHSELHDMVFPHGFTSTPSSLANSSTVHSGDEKRPPAPSHASVGRVRPRSDTLMRPSSSIPPVPPLPPIADELSASTHGAVLSRVQSLNRSLRHSQSGRTESVQEGQLGFKHAETPGRMKRNSLVLERAKSLSLAAAAHNPEGAFGPSKFARKTSVVAVDRSEVQRLLR